MTTAIAINGNHNTDIITFDDEKIGLIKRTIAKGATDDELALFMHQAQKTGLDPLARQIYFQKYNTKNGPQIAIITGIDGYRLVAVRTGLYAGNDAPEFEGRMKYAGVDVPVKASVTVYRIVGNRRCPFTASVYWDEYCPGAPKDYQWKKMPHVMLAKCAEAAALRKAFPADLSGVYTQEEMGQADWFEVEEPTVTKQLNGSKQEVQPDPVEDGYFEEPEQHAPTDWSMDFLNHCADNINRYAGNPHKAKQALMKQFDNPPVTKSAASQQFKWLKEHAAKRDMEELEAAQKPLFDDESEPVAEGAYSN